MNITEIQSVLPGRILKQVIFFCLIFLCVSKNASAALAPISCSAINNTNLSVQADYDFDSRLNGLTTATGTINQWTTRGNGTTGWARNMDAWTQRGDVPVDWTGVSPWNSNGGYNQAGVLISPRHIAFAKHYQMSVGTTIIFIDLQGNIVSRTISKTASLTSSDITIGELDSDVPNTIAFYPIIDATVFEKKLDITNLPIIEFDQEDHLIVAEHNGYSFERWQSWIQGKGLGTSYPEIGIRTLFNETIIGGDSGNPMFTIINNQPILISTVTAGGSGGGPLYPARITEINALIAGFGSTSTVLQYDVSCWNDAVQELVVTTNSNVTLDISTAQNNDVVAAFSTQNIHSSAYTQVTYSIISGDTDGKFSIQNATNTIPCYGHQNCIYTDGKLNLADKTKLTLGAQYDLVIRSATTTSSGLPLIKDFSLHINVVSATTTSSPYTWSTKTTLQNASRVVQSFDGTKMFAIKEVADYIYKSIDSGETWSPILDLPSVIWRDLALSANGNNVYAAGQFTGMYLYMSHNGGQSWATTTGSGVGYWKFLDTSSDGSIVASVTHTITKPYLISKNYGQDWVTVPKFGSSSYWAGISMSNNGQTIVAISSFLALPLAGYLYISKDGGDTWNIIIGQSKAFRSSIGVSGDGRTIVFADEEKYIHISKDGGDTWSIITKTGEMSWTALSLSDDGFTIVGTTRSGKVLYSLDRGDTWFIYNLNNTQTRSQVTVSGDGKTLVEVGPYMSTTNIARISVAAYTIISTIASSTATSTATVTWQTDTPSTTQIQYGLTSSYTASSSLNLATSTSHTVNLSGLSPGTSYHYRVFSRNVLGNLTTSSDQIFTTNAIVDTTPPVISLISSSVATSSATIIWTTNKNSTTQVQYGLTSSYTASSTLDLATTTSHTVNLSGLTSNTIYHYRVLSRNVLGNLTTSSDQIFTTNAIVETIIISPTSGGGGGGGGGGGSFNVSNTLVLPQIDKATTTTTILNDKGQVIILNNVNDTTTQKIVTLLLIQTITKNLQILVKSPEVLNLQRFLNAQGYTVSKVGAGSVGKETTLFGSATKAALIKFQKANGIVPASGFFGPLTRAKIKRMK
ncbi:fibronectin type III domain-containing protein [Arenimonas sp.]|nr:fibronectin type III domain-containing protein [Candidatus Parcubacteria bacterium]